MRKKLALVNGTLGLALAASVFLGCQEFMGGDHGNTAAPSSNQKVEQVAQAIVSQDSAKDSPPAASTAATAQDQPVQAAVATPAPAQIEPVKPAEPVVTEPAQPAPASASLSPEQEDCVNLFNELQTAKEPRYGEVKNLYGSQNCEVVLGDKKPSTYVPLTTEEKCKMYRYNVIHTPSTGDPKYDAYMAEMAITCAAYP